MKSCFFICIGCAVLAAAINCFVGPYMIGWFITSPTATDIDCAMKYLKIASVFMLPLAWIFAYRNGLQGLNKGLVPMLSGAMELVSRWIAILALSKPCRSGSLAYNRNTTYCDLLCVGDAHEEEGTDKIDFTQIGLFVVQLSHG